MNHFKRIFCLVLAAVFALTLAGCDKGGNPSSALNSVIEEVSSADDISSEETSSVVSRYDYYNDMNNLKPLDGVVDSRPDYTTSNSVQTTVVFDWPGPYGYVIVTPANNLNAYNSAVLLQTYFKNTYGQTLEIVTDSTAPTNREILVGKTNRSESDKSLRDSNLVVSVKGEKLVFDGGHDVTVDLAVKKFLKLAPSTRGVCTFSETTDFTSTKDGGYTYVWGDEFEMDGLDRNKWSDKNSKMSGGGVLKLVSNSNTVSVKNGVMQLTAYKDSYGDYYAPSSIHTKETMNYKYGYVEIKAKLSTQVGSFASFWTRSVSDFGGLIDGIYSTHFAEVDIFEVCQKGGVQSLAGNIIKISKDTKKMRSWYGSDMMNAQSQPLVDENYHIIAYEWTSSEIKYYFDGKMYARFDITSDWVNGPESGRGRPGWTVGHYYNNRDKYASYFDNTGTGMDCFREAQYLIFNHHLHIAVDDGNGGKKGFLASTSVTENTNFQRADYVIDYVRLYQQSGQTIKAK